MVGGSASTEGILEIYFNGIAGNICNHSWNSKNTLVACRQLGYTDGFSYTAPSTIFNTETKAWRYWLDKVDCNGNEANIHDCPHSTWGEIYCDMSHEGFEVAIVCNGTDSDFVIDMTLPIQ